eukprot:12863914-Alexandrium_andersonii.AAC.1
MLAVGKGRGALNLAEKKGYACGGGCLDSGAGSQSYRPTSVHVLARAALNCSHPPESMSRAPAA